MPASLGIWPPTSPVLNVMGCCCWPHVQNFVNNEAPTSPHRTNRGDQEGFPKVGARRYPQCDRPVCTQAIKMRGGKRRTLRVQNATPLPKHAQRDELVGAINFLRIFERARSSAFAVRSVVWRNFGYCARPKPHSTRRNCAP